MAPTHRTPFLLACLLLCGARIALAQPVPTPAPAQVRPVLLRGATLHIGDGSAPQRADLLLVQGRIAAIGEALPADGDPEVIDLQGRHVYPGLIAPVVSLGLQEIEAVRSTNDAGEVGPLNPNARAIVAYNTDSRVTPTLRSNGILLAQVTPDGGLLKGQSSVVQLDAWSWEDAAYKLDDAMHVDWPSQQIMSYPGAPAREEQERRIRERMAMLDNIIDEGRAYAEAKASALPPKIDLRLEALLPVLRRDRPVFISAESEKDIRSALEFCQRQNLRMVLVGGSDAWLHIDLLRKLQVPVVLRKPHSLPRQEDDPVALPFETARILHRAGVLTCLSMDSYWNYRNLPFQAGQAAAFGLDKEEALQLVTLNTARILGIDARTGSLAVGKDANIVVSTGDLLDMRTSHVELAFIQGRKIDLGNKQKDLNAKYLEKYGKH